MKNSSNKGLLLTVEQKEEVEKLIATTPLNALQRNEVNTSIWKSIAAVTIALGGLAYWFLSFSTTQQVGKAIDELHANTAALVDELKRKNNESDSLIMVMEQRIHATAKPLIGLLSDFGSGAYYVGRFKGNILNSEPDAHIVDITHEIQKYNVLEGSWTLFNAAKTFPSGSIIVAIVNPGADLRNARFVITKSPKYYLVGAALQVFDYAASEFGVQECYVIPPIEDDDIFGTQTFLPLIVDLLNRSTIEEIKTKGRIGKNPIPYEPKVVKVVYQGSVINGQICTIDRWGNLQTNIPSGHLVLYKEYVARVRERSLRVIFGKSYSDGATHPGVLVQQDGWIQIARFKDSASVYFGVHKAGDLVTIKPTSN